MPTITAGPIAKTAGDFLARNTNKAAVDHITSTEDLRDRAIRAVLKEIALAAARHDATATVDLGATLRILEGSSHP